MKTTINLTATEAAVLRAFLYDKGCNQLYAPVGGYSALGRAYEKLCVLQRKGRFKFLSPFNTSEKYYLKENV